jgi:hypothetical protein
MLERGFGGTGDGGGPVAGETLFDRAWLDWRRSLSDALAPPEIAAGTRRALEAAGAFDPTDGLIDRDWALALLIDQEPARRLSAHGVGETEIERLVALLRRHPAPAAGG